MFASRQLVGGSCRHAALHLPSVGGEKLTVLCVQSSVDSFEPAEGYGATALPVAPSRNWRGAAALKFAVLTLAVVAVLAVSGVFTSSDKEVVLGDSSMKRIDNLLAHIDKITHDAQAGHNKDKSVKDQIAQSSVDDEVNSSAPKSVRKGGSAVNTALMEAQQAERSLKTSGLHATSTAAEEKKKRAIANKMRALTAQIQSDFQKVTGFGNKAGFVPPVKMPHM